MEMRTASQSGSTAAEVNWTRGDYATDGRELFRVLSIDLNWVELEDQRSFGARWMKAATASALLRRVEPAEAE